MGSNPASPNPPVTQSTNISRALFWVCLILSVSLPASGEERAENSTLKINAAAFEQAKQLIGQKQFISDGKGAWTKHRPSAADENAFIRVHGFAEYSKWHLAIDDRYPENTKARYKFPYGDFQAVHRCGLLAVESRARQNGYVEIENAAASLIQMMPRQRAN